MKMSKADKDRMRAWDKRVAEERKKMSSFYMTLMLNAGIEFLRQLDDSIKLHERDKDKTELNRLKKRREEDAAYLEAFKGLIEQRKREEAEESASNE